MLSDSLGALTVGECVNVHELLELVRRKEWDVLILDIGMPCTTGTEALMQVKKERPSLPVIILSMHPEDQYAVRMFKAGADAYLTKAGALFGRLNGFRIGLCCSACHRTVSNWTTGGYSPASSSIVRRIIGFTLSARS